MTKHKFEGSQELGGFTAGCTCGWHQGTIYHNRSAAVEAYKYHVEHSRPTLSGRQFDQGEVNVR